jgi:type VI protein secretion system component VasF
MNENELNHMLKRAASAGARTGISLESEVMARVRVDDGRAKRWRSFVQWLLILAAAAGVVTAGMVGWSMALKDTTHTTPPTMNLFREGLPK